MDEKTQAALDAGIRDTMWQMFWRGKQAADLPELEEAVKRLIRMATQKNAGQRSGGTCIDWKSLDMEFMRIAIEATAFVLDTRFPEIRDAMEAGTAWKTDPPTPEHDTEYLVRDVTGVVSGRLWHVGRGWGKPGKPPKEGVAYWTEMPK